MPDTLKTLLELPGGPAFAIMEGRLAHCNPQARALGFLDGMETELLPVRLPEQADAPLELPLSWGGGTWILRAAAWEKGLLCWLRPAAAQVPGPNENTLLHTAGTIRLALQDLSTALNGLAELPALQEGVGARCGALALRSLFLLNRTAGNLERFSRLREGRWQLRAARRDLRDLTEQLCLEAQGLLAPAELRLEWQLPERPLFRNLDWNLVSALIWELLNNAAANSQDGQLRLELLRVGRTGMRILVSNRAALPSLPEELFQRHSVRRQELQGGLGLGLSTVSLGATLHGGSLLLFTGDDGAVTAALSLRSVPAARQDLNGPRLIPAESLPKGLTALSTVLPPECYRLEELG